MLEGQTFAYRVYSIETREYHEDYEELFNCETEIECEEYFQKKVAELKENSVGIGKTMYSYQAQSLMKCMVEFIHGEEIELWNQIEEYITEVYNWDK